MHTFVELIIIVILLIFCVQMYFFSVNSKGTQRQDRCLRLGIAYMTIGIVALVFKTASIVSFGLVMMMFGFSLIAKGLDRLNKSIYIDQLEDDL